MAKSMFMRPFVILSLFAITAPSALAELTPDKAALVQQRVAELRNRLGLKLPGGRDWGAVDEQVTVAALLAIIEEERAKPHRGAIYHQALRELGRYPDSSAAVKRLVADIDTGNPPAPRLQIGNALEGYTAALTLAKGGVNARRAILDALARPQSERKLHLMAYVLVRLDQDQGAFDVELPVLRLKKEIKHLEANLAGAKENKGNLQLKNLQRMIAIMQDPAFGRVTAFPAE